MKSRWAEQEDWRGKSGLYYQLLRRTDIFLFEFDPAVNRMVASYPVAGDQREERVQERFYRWAEQSGRIHPGDLSCFRRTVGQPGGPEKGTFDYRSRHSLEENYHWYRAYYCRVPAPAGRGEYIMGLCMDVEEEKRLATRLVEAATDGVSGLLGRAAAESRMSAAMREDNRPYACFLYDIDNFKRVNDTFGHQVGDRLLVRVAGVLRSSFREGDILGRLGGDEFVVLMRGVSDPKLVRERAEATVRGIQALSCEAECPLPISVSLGVAYDPGASRNFRQMYRLADKALYRAKWAGKNRHVFLELDPLVNLGGAAE